MKHRESGYSKGFGFVKYATLEAAGKAIEGMDGKVSLCMASFLHALARIINPFPIFLYWCLGESCAKSIKHDASRSTFKMQLFSFRSSIILLFPGCNSCIDDNRVVIVVLMTMISNSLLNSFCTYFWWTDFLFCVFQFLDGWVIFVEYAKPRQPPTLPSQNNTNFQYGRQWWPVRAIGLREKLVGHS